MLFPFGCQPGLCDPADGRRRHQERKLHLLRSWRDTLERQLAAVNAALSTLEHQMERDRNPAPEG